LRDDDIVAAARVIGAKRDLIADTAALNELVTRADAGERVADDILELLTLDRRLWEEFRRHVRQGQERPRGPVQDGMYVDLPGDGDPSAEIVYQCSTCGYEFPVFEVGEPVPECCPQGHSPLT